MAAPPERRQLLSRRSAAVHAQICKHQKAWTEPEPAAKRGVRVTRNQQNPTPDPGAASQRIFVREQKQPGLRKTELVLNLNDNVDVPVGTLSHRRWVRSLHRSSSPPSVPLPLPHNPRSQHSQQHSRDTSTNNHRPPPTRTSTAAPAGTFRRGGNTRGGERGPKFLWVLAAPAWCRVGSEAALSFPTQSELDAFVL